MLGCSCVLRHAEQCSVGNWEMCFVTGAVAYRRWRNTRDGSCICIPKPIDYRKGGRDAGQRGVSEKGFRFDLLVMRGGIAYHLVRIE